MTLSRMGIVNHSFPQRRFKDTIEFIDYCHNLGAGGVQTTLASTEPGYAKRVRSRIEELGMYFEAQSSLINVERVAPAAREAGALCIRVACLSGRRYETFSTLDEWRKFAVQSRAALERALKLAELHGIRLAVENHKDWTAEEMAVLLKGYASEYLGCCLDSGNNVALLDDPRHTFELLAPFAVSTHIKDMGVDEYSDGFLLSEVPLGTGIIDLKAFVAAVTRARISLEMITRDPLKIPCLTEKYWATFPDRKAPDLARTLAIVRARRRSLPRVSNLEKAEALQVEEENVKQSLNYARTHLGL
jgi:sugar phosphate isomerase/epimerase